jgi:ABC-type multidrug transport system fused ATPase/permease subunit
MPAKSSAQPSIAPVSMRPDDLHILWRCYSFLRPYAALVAVSYAAMLGVNVANMFTPQIIRWIIDRGIGDRNTSVLAWAVLGLLGLTLIKGVLTFLQGRQSETAGQSVAYDLRGRLQRKLTELSFAFLNQAETGELLSRSMQDVERVRMITGRATIRMINSIVMLLITAIILLWMNPRLALFAVAAMPLLAWRAIHYGRRSRPLSLAIQRQLAALTTRLEQNLRGARVVKAFAQERAEVARFGDQNEAWFDVSVQAVRLASVNNPLMSMIANLKEIQEHGMDAFLARQAEKYRCPTCHGLRCVHRSECLSCDQRDL